VALPETLRLAELIQSFAAVFADRREHQESTVTAGLEQRQGRQLRDRVEVGVADRLCGFERERSREDRQPGEQLPRLVG
jgi:hypothetical protein